MHEPSGTTANATTNSAGAFNLTGLRPGGPYTVTVTAPGFPPVTSQNLLPERGSALCPAGRRGRYAGRRPGGDRHSGGKERPAGHGVRSRQHRQRSLGVSRYPRHRPSRSVRFVQSQHPRRLDRGPERPDQPLLGRWRALLGQLRPEPRRPSQRARPDPLGRDRAAVRQDRAL
ncbi:carboxypeptidase-like regulatory domain-containing protein [Caulobacter sp. UC70_42]|uniref:carboxypeptidase-like regulatory domain-containing protein n=1 Tax=Caulobacter sp. UC70_42 TaxID=3374551 RepID=UPI003757E2F7